MNLEKRIFNVRASYIVIFLTLSAWAIFAYSTMNELINSQKIFAKIINVSGKQRMLSQKTALMVNRVVKSNNPKLLEHLKQLNKKFQEDHIFIINNLTSTSMVNIYFHKPYNLDKEIQEYLNLLDKFIINYQTGMDTKSIVKEIEKFSYLLLPKLNNAVNEFEKESEQNTLELQNRELFILIGTLFTLLLEVVFIMFPAIRIINESKEKMDNFNTILKEEVKSKTRALKKSNKLKDRLKNKLIEKQHNLSKYTIYSRTDLKGRIIDASIAFCKVSGYSKKELLGKPHSLIRHPDMSKDFFKDLWKTIKNDKVWVGEIKNKNKQGQYYWTHTTISPEYDDKRNVVGYFSIRHDITAKKNFELQQKKLFEQAKLVSMGEMIGNIAHQWRQPLNAITVAASGLQLKYQMNMLKDGEVDELSDHIIRNSEYLSETIETFRNFITENKVTKSVVIQDEIKQVLQIIKPSLNNDFIKLKKNIDNTRAIRIKLTSGELPQVLINLLNNSKDAIIENKIKDPYIKVTCYEKGDNVYISIKDNGGGIPSEIIDRIFEPYFTTKHKSEGTGLGLHMSYRIITESLNGKIQVKNTKYGVKFTLILPLV